MYFVGQKDNRHNTGILAIQAACFSKIVYLMLLPHPLGIVCAKTQIYNSLYFPVQLLES